MTIFVPQSSSFMGDVLRHYVRTVSTTKRSYATEAYRIKALSGLLGDIKLGEVTVGHVAAFRDQRLSMPHPRDPKRTLATSTVKLEMMLLSHVFSVAITEWGLHDLQNPVLKVRKPKAPPGRSRRLTTAEEKRLLHAAWVHPNPQFHVIVVLALETAARQGEILAISVEHISWRKRTVLLPQTKNGEVREIPLSRRAYEVLRGFVGSQLKGRVFSYSTSGLKSTWKVFVRALGLVDFHFHDLRHCAISSLLERGLNTIEVASISGHKSMSMLKRYSHLFAARLVHKLDPKPRGRRERPVLREHLPSFPAILVTYSRRIEVHFPDFVCRVFVGPLAESVLEQAKNWLLQHLVKSLCDGNEIPEPTPLEAVVLSMGAGRKSVVLIAPI